MVCVGDFGDTPGSSLSPISSGVPSDVEAGGNDRSPTRSSDSEMDTAGGAAPLSVSP